MKSNKEEILRLYFDEKLKQVEISKKLNISNNAVSKVLKKDNRFTNEKNRRKIVNKQKHNRKIQKWVENSRKNVSTSDIQILKKMHEQASLELSGGKRPIGNRAFRDWNTSAYKYNPKNKSYVLRKDIKAGADVPKIINWRSF